MTTETKVAPIEVEFWWVPQVPMKAFTRAVATVSQGRMLEEAFALYDLFQLENRVKPDYCNAGGLEEYFEGDWTEWYSADGDTIVETVALDRKAWNAIKRRWARTKIEAPLRERLAAAGLT